MTKTRIEWTDEGWNPVTGCTKVSDGCKNCYAEREWPRFYGRQTVKQVLSFDGEQTPIGERSRKFTDVRCHPERLDAPLHWKKPRRVFVNSMSDLFHDAVPREFIDAVWSTMAEAKQHTFQILTKRPRRMMQFMLNRQLDGWKANWQNIWLGVSVENQAAADERIPLLLQTPAAVRFISAEPLLGPVDLSRYLEFVTGVPGCLDSVNPIDWVIAGGESGPKARPMHPDWVRSLRDQCNAVGVAFFFKQWGEWAPNCLCGRSVACKEVPRPQPGRMGCMFRCGKRKAGHLLDGRTWKEYPDAAI